MMKATSSLDKKPEVVLDAIYQVQRPNGEFKRKYVKTIRTYGEDIEAEIILDRDHPELEGKRLTVPAALLLKPDTYPKFMFQPSTWHVKATQTLDQMKAEAETVIEAWFKTEGVTAASDNQQDSSKVIVAIKRLLTGNFGGFSLGLMLYWIKNKIDARLRAGGTNVKPMPFERKLGTIKRELAERNANLAKPVDQRGYFNQGPRPVQQFGQEKQ